MGLLPWEDKYSVNIAKIDLQHKKLVEAINAFQVSLLAGHSRKDMQKVFASVLDYTLHHFKTEEDLMIEHGFPGLEEHRKEHERFTKEIVAYLDTFLDTDKDIATDMAAYLLQWLERHVFSMDRKYSVFLNDRGVF